MDELDLKILDRLVRDGRASLQDVAESVGLRRPSVHERVRKLEKAGVVRGYHAELDPAHLQAATLAYVFIEVALGTGGKQDCLACCETIAERLRRMPQVLECQTLAGTEDMMVKLRCRDLSELEHLVMREISGLPGVRRVQTKIALRTHFERPLAVAARKEKGGAA